MKLKEGGWVGFIEVVVVVVRSAPVIHDKAIIPKLGKLFCQHQDPFQLHVTSRTHGLVIT
jgi:hypothetical protein